jgi:RNA polymerase sigma-70 factor (ECF subfamily)
MGIVGVKRGVSMPGARSSSTAPSDFAAFRATCAEATPKVYAWIFGRCGDVTLAEDMTSETLLAAVGRFRDGRGAEVTTAWLMTVARSKLVDHWRRAEREQRRLRLAWNGRDEGHVPWSEDSSITRALTALRQLEPAHQAVLTLRYLDNLPVAEVARALGRSVHATESLLIRAKSTFRRAYAGCSDD